MQPRAHRRSVREVTGWNRTATLYTAAMVTVCAVLQVIHP